MKWWVVYMALGLMACGNGVNEKQGHHTTEDIGKADSLPKYEVESSEKKISLEDSIFIQTKISELNTEYYAERSDSMGGWHAEDAEVLYSQDSSLKIYSFLGEYIGAYGSPMYHSTSIYKGKIRIDTSFLTAYSIFKHPKAQFLKFAQGQKPMRGPEWSYFEEAYLFSNYDISKICQSQLSHWIENTTGNSSFYPNKNEDIDSLENRIVYKPDNKTIKCTAYGYNEEEYIYGEVLPCYKVSSTYQLIGNQFKLVETDSIFDTRLFH